MLSAAVLLGVAAFIIFVIRKIRKYYALSAFRGPWSSGFSRLWLLKANASGEMHKYFTAVNDNYGVYYVQSLCFAYHTTLSSFFQSPFVC